MSIGAQLKHHLSGAASGAELHLGELSDANGSDAFKPAAVVVLDAGVDGNTVERVRCGAIYQHEL